MLSKTSFIVLGLVLAVVLLISTEVAAKDLVSANGVEDVIYDVNNGGGRGGNELEGRGGYNSGNRGHGGHGGGSRGGGNTLWPSVGPYDCPPNQAPVCCGRLGTCRCC